MRERLTTEDVEEVLEASDRQLHGAAFLSLAIDLERRC